ncbi:putative reverse transcriptase domain-containing protein [Tanacetum coccineum]
MEQNEEFAYNRPNHSSTGRYVHVLCSLYGRQILFFTLIDWLNGVDGSLVTDGDGRAPSRFKELLRHTVSESSSSSTITIQIVGSQASVSSERTIQTLEDMLRAGVIDFGKGWVNHLPLVEFSYNNSYHASIKAAPFEALYGRKCRSPVCWAEVGEVQLTGLEIVQKKIEKIIHIKQRIQAARDRQIEFQVRDSVMLKVSPWKGVVHFGKQGKLNPRYVGPFKVLENVRAVAYKLKLPQELGKVHNTFHVSNLKKCHANEPLAIPLDGLHIDDKLHFVKELVVIMDRDIKRLKQSRIPIVKVRWNSRRGPELHGNARINFERNIHISSQRPHRCQVSRLKP